jgi:hypothetical protein
MGEIGFVTTYPQPPGLTVADIPGATAEGAAT